MHSFCYGEDKVKCLDSGYLEFCDFTSYYYFDLNKKQQTFKQVSVALEIWDKLFSSIITLQ